MKIKNIHNAASPPGFRFGGGKILGDRPRRRSGGIKFPPGRKKILKISKEFLKKKCKKWIILGDFSKK